jgi:3-dehydroquinate synthase
LRTKRWFIEIDEYDHKERLLLNFGHTFGHAIEGAVNFAIPHGIAVGMGMLAAIAYARLIGQLEATPQRVAKLETCIWSMLKEVPELPHWASTIAANELMDRFNADKKHSSTNYVVIVPNAEGQLVRLELPKSDANSMLIFKAFGEVCQACSRTC